MKKKEFRWLSRDKYSAIYKVWRKKPKPDKSSGYYLSNLNTGFIQVVCFHYIEPIIKLKQGGLAKITIERQY